MSLAQSKWKVAAASVRWNIQPFIGGQYRKSTSTASFDNINPAIEAVLCRVQVGNASDVDVAVQVARQRFTDGSWSQLSAAQRVSTFHKWADLIASNKEEIALLDCLEMGKPITTALSEVEGLAPGLLRAIAGFADKLVGESVPVRSHSVAFNTFEPRGVVGAITPWNFPLANAVLKVAPALAAGNCVVLKPSELSSGSALRLAELAIEAGIPEGVLNVVPGLGGTVGAALASHADVDLVSFTGSTMTGRKIIEMSGRSNGKPVLLELGGKSPQVVFADADNLDRIADAVVGSFLWNQGQVCSAHTRLIVEQSIKQRLLDKIVARTRKFVPADPLDETTTFGPLASTAQRDRVAGYIKLGLDAGAKPVLLGAVQASGGCNAEPTIFDDVDPKMTIVQEEIFGPVLCVEGFTSEVEAIERANATRYGLVATIWTRDVGRGMRAASQIRSGEVTVRTSGEEGPDQGYMLGREPQKASGFGSELGIRGLQAYSTLKMVSFIGR